MHNLIVTDTAPFGMTTAHHSLVRHSIMQLFNKDSHLQMLQMQLEHSVNKTRSQTVLDACVHSQASRWQTGASPCIAVSYQTNSN